MSVLSWIRGLFSSAGPDDEAAEREELGVADRGENEIQKDFGRPDLATSESADLVRSELEAFERPPDPDP